MRKFILILATLLAVSVFTISAQNQLPNDPAVRKGKLENGLTYYIMKNANPEGRAEFYLATDAGAIQETPDQDGLAHFLEHMCFNGTKNFPEKGLLNWLQSIGASFGGNVNASTGVEQTVYMLTNIPLVRPTVVDSCILILHDYSHFVECDPVEIDKERGVILEERRSRRTSSWRMHEKSLPYYYGDSKYSTCTIIGSKENLETFKPESLTNFYKTWYRPDMQAVIVVGDIEPDYVEAKIKEIFSDIPAAENPKAKDVIKVPNNKEPMIGIITDPEAIATSMEVFWKFEAMPEELNSTVEGAMFSYIKSIISSVMSERFNDIVAKSDAPFLSGSFGIGNMCESMEVQMGRISANEGKALEAFRAYYTELLKMKKFGLNDDEIERAKSEILAYYESAAKKADTRKNASLVQPLIDNFFDNYAYMEPEKEYEIIKQISAMIPSQAINMTLSQGTIPDSNMVVVYKAPEKEGLSHPTAEDFIRVINEVRNSDIKANETEAISRDFLDPTALKGSTIKKETAGINGSTVWMLKNGLKVILRPSDIEKNVIVFNLSKPGGKSVIPTEDLNKGFDSNIWSSFQSFCGISKFPATVVTKMLSGKQVSVSPYLSELRHGISGNSTPQDLETALQLIYLYFADPRFDPEEFDKAIKQLEAITPNYMKQPGYKLNCHFSALAYGENPRVTPYSDKILAAADLSVIEKHYRALFNDAAGAEIIICGDFKADEIRPMVEKYLGSIMKGKKALKWIDRNTDIVPGSAKDDFKTDMQTPKVTAIVMHSTILDKYSLKEDVALSAAEYILDMRYVKSLREDEGGTYGASVASSLSILPKPEVLVQVAFETKPEAADKLVGICEETLQNLASEGPDAEEFDMAKKNLLKKIPESRITNRYWLQSIRYMELYGIDYDKDYEAYVNSLTAEDVKSIMQKIVSAGNAKTIIMRPESEKE